MNDEEKKAIKILGTFEFRQKTINYNKIDLEDVESTKTVLNLITKLQKGNETKIIGFENEELSCNKFIEKVGKDIIDYKFEYENNQKIINELQKENEEKDKQIKDLQSRKKI